MKGKKLTLDVGCGPTKCGDVNIDIKKNVGPTVVADACALPFPDKIFSRVTAHNVLEHIVNYEQALHELQRVASGTVEVRLDTTFSLANWLHPEHEWIAINFRLYRRPWILRAIMSPLKLLSGTLPAKIISWVVSWTLRWRTTGLNPNHFHS